MNYPQKLDFKGSSRKLYASPSATNLSNKIGAYMETHAYKLPKVRRTDHTDQRISERSPSRSRVFGNQYYNGIGEERSSMMDADSRVSGQGNHSRDNGLRLLTQKQQRIIELKERLKNIHHFYRIRIEEERKKNLQRNEIFIGIIQQLQQGHNEKISNCQRQLEELEDEKRDIGYVDERMGNIKTTIQEILMQSKDLKNSNQAIEKQIMQKQIDIKEKEAQYMTIKQEMQELRDRLEYFQRLKLKQNKRNKEILQMISDNY